jgi:hypothetical protein
MSGGDGYTFGSNTYDIEAARLRMYNDYDIMDNDAIIASALDIYADTATVKDANGQMLTIRTKDPKIKKILYNLFYDVLNIEFNLWSWTRELCKHGDYFLMLTLNEKHGVTNIIPVHPGLIQREENFDPSRAGEFRFKYVGESSDYIKSQYIEQFELIHFRLLADTKYLPYGKSAIESARREYKKLSLFEDAMLLQRIMRAPERRVFKVDIGAIAPEEVDGYMKDFIGTMKKVPYVDPATGDYNLKFNLQTMLEDFYLPVRGSDSGTDISTLPGLASENHTQDVEYSKSKVLAALKIPKAWLGYDESIDGKANTAGLDIRFASTIERVQKVIESEFYKIALIHLHLQGFETNELMDFELMLSNSSTIRKRQEIDVLNEKMNLATNMLESKLFSKEFIYERLFDLSEEEWKYEHEQVFKDTQDTFRLSQIEEEGNDPKVTGKSFGTPHDIASMQMTSRVDGQTIKNMYTQDQRENNEGRPEEQGTFGTDDDSAFGRDPDGRKAAERIPNAESIFARYDAMKATLLTEDIDKEIEKQFDRFVYNKKDNV